LPMVTRARRLLRSNRLLRRQPARLQHEPPIGHSMKRYLVMTVSVLAGATLLEAALIPGILIGGGIVLAPKVLSKYLPRRRRHMGAPKVALRKSVKSAARALQPLNIKAPLGASERFLLKRAILKTITFRIIVTSLDFVSNYLVIDELAAAASLSAIGFVAGPLFYLVHEMVWNRLGPSGAAIRLHSLIGPQSGAAPLIGRRELTINRALAKTITFRTVATTMDFGASYLIVGEVATAAGLAAFGFVVGPFVYYGHEKAWDYFEDSGPQVLKPDWNIIR
jgi:uncharacterized membrane protein